MRSQMEILTWRCIGALAALCICVGNGDWLVPESLSECALSLMRNDDCIARAACCCIFTSTLLAGAALVIYLNSCSTCTAGS